MPLPTGVRRVVHSVALPWMAFTLIVYLFARAGGFVQTWGRDYTITLNHFRTAFNMDIYVQRRDGAVRLGFAPAKETTRFPIAPGLIAGSGIVEFSARPTRGGESAASDPFTVHPGDELTWIIPL